MYSSSDAYFAKVAENFTALRSLSPLIESVATRVAEAVRGGNKVMFCGNGGSAADSQHLATELMARYLVDRRPLPAIALTVDTSALTAIANDYAFAEVFARQLRGIGQAGDVLIALSTSGNSENVLRAVSVGKDMGITTIGLTGRTGGKLRAACDICVCTPADEASHIQEMHIAIGHYLCGFVENAVC